MLESTRSKVMLPPLGEKHTPVPITDAKRLAIPWLVWCAVLLYILVFVHVTFQRYDRFLMMSFDLGIFDQATWLISQGETPFVTVRGLPILADHYSIVLYLLAPLYRVWASPKTLLLAQTVALAWGALPVYAMAYHRFNSKKVAGVFAIGYLLCPAVQWSNFSEFHPDIFATPLLLGAIHYLNVKRWKPYFLMLFLSTCAKETVGLTILCLGFYVFSIHKRIGFMTVLMGALALVVANATVRHFAHGVSSPYWWLYSQYGASPAGIAWNLVQHPFAAMRNLATPLNAEYMVGLFGPLALLPLAAPDILLIAGPALLANLLSSRPDMHSIHNYYNATIVPIFFFAAIVGYDRLLKRPTLISIRNHPVGNVVLSGCAALTILIGLTQDSCWSAITEEAQAQSVAHYDSSLPQRGLFNMIPKDACVAAQSALVPHLSHRSRIYLFPNPFVTTHWGASLRALRQIDRDDFPVATPESLDRNGSATRVEYIALWPRSTPFPLHREQFNEFVELALCSPSYGIVLMDHDVILLKRGSAHDSGLGQLVPGNRGRITDSDIKKAYRDWLFGQFVNE